MPRSRFVGFMRRWGGVIRWAARRVWRRFGGLDLPLSPTRKVTPSRVGLELIVEARWVREKLADPVHKGQGMRYLTHLEVVWKKAHRSWDVWTKFPIK